MKNYILIAVFALMLGGCLNEKSAYTNEVCIADTSILGGVEPSCKEGQIFSFQPQSWGNEQIPITISTYFCDFNYPIVQNRAGVSCVYKRRFNVAKP